MSWWLGAEWKRSVGSTPSPSCCTLWKKGLCLWGATAEPQLRLMSEQLKWVTSASSSFGSFLESEVIFEVFDLFMPPSQTELKLFTFDVQQTKAKLSASMGGDRISLTPKLTPKDGRNGKDFLKMSKYFHFYRQFNIQKEIGCVQIPSLLFPPLKDYKVWDYLVPWIWIPVKQMLTIFLFFSFFKCQRWRHSFVKKKQKRMSTETIYESTAF